MINQSVRFSGIKHFAVREAAIRDLSSNEYSDIGELKDAFARFTCKIEKQIQKEADKFEPHLTAVAIDTATGTIPVKPAHKISELLHGYQSKRVAVTFPESAVLLTNNDARKFWMEGSDEIKDKFEKLDLVVQALENATNALEGEKAKKPKGLFAPLLKKEEYQAYQARKRDILEEIKAAREFQGYLKSSLVESQKAYKSEMGRKFFWLAEARYLAHHDKDLESGSPAEETLLP